MTISKRGAGSVTRSIIGEFMLLLTVIIVPFSFVIGWYVFSSFNQFTIQQQLQSLESLAEEKSSTINQYIDDHIGRIETLSLMPVTTSAIAAFSDAFQTGIDSELYDRTNTDYAEVYKRYLSYWNYYDLFLIDLQGNIVFSIKHESDIGSNLKSGPYGETALGQVFKQSLLMLQANNSTFTYYEPSKEVGAFVATPVISGGKVIGVIALQFDTNIFYDVINNLVGLGASGEVVVGQVVNDKILLTAPLRHDPDAAFKRTIELDAVNALPIREGSQGGTGSDIMIDWRGEEVLAVWQYIPALKWGMVVKIDTEEVFGHWQYIQRNLIVFIGLGLFISYLLIYLFTRRITRPLRKLTQASLAYAAGKHDIQIDSLLEINNEAGALANAFGEMISQVQSSKAELEQTVAELAENNRTLDQRVVAQTEHIQGIIKYSADGIITMNAKGDIESVNPALCDIFAYREHELIGQPMTMLMPEKYREAHQAGFKRYSKGEKDFHFNLSVELEGLRKSGELFPLDLHINEMCIGSETLFLGNIRDITEEKTKREKLEHTQRLESLGILAGGIAHDFNNLLTAILGNAALAKGRIDHKSPATEMLVNIEKSSERAAVLCKQMLAYSGKGHFVVEVFNLNELIEEMMNLLEVSIEKSVMLRLDLSEQCLPIEADVAQMQQVIMNLVINASEAIENHSGMITIHSAVVDIDHAYAQSLYMENELLVGRYVVLEVSDTGCGMDEETKKHLFDPFFTTKFTGRGLGMSAILGIIRGHKGAIKVYSEQGKGSTFRMLFPCSGAMQVEQKNNIKEAVRSEDRGTILIVDDEENIRETAAMMLEDIGFTTLEAKDGLEGMAMFRQHQSVICAVLLDMTMPHMIGDEVFHAIRDIEPDMKVILSSGYSEQDATKSFAGKGLSGFIQKPYGPDDLQSIVLEVLNDK